VAWRKVRCASEDADGTMHPQAVVFIVVDANAEVSATVVKLGTRDAFVCGSRGTSYHSLGSKSCA
jgi:hypothetical protein